MTHLDPVLVARKQEALRRLAGVAGVTGVGVGDGVVVVMVRTEADRARVTAALGVGIPFAVRVTGEIRAGGEP